MTESTVNAAVRLAREVSDELVPVSGLLADHLLHLFRDLIVRHRLSRAVDLERIGDYSGRVPEGLHKTVNALIDQPVLGVAAHYICVVQVGIAVFLDGTETGETS